VPIEEMSQSYFLNLFYYLQGKKSSIDCELYKRLRNNVNYQIKDKYNGRHRSFIIQHAAKILQTITKNNVVNHMYKRVRKYFKTAFPHLKNKEVYENLKVLFNAGDHLENQYITQFRQQFGLSQDFNFVGYEKKWWEYYNFLYRLQYYLSTTLVPSRDGVTQHQVKSFKLLTNFLIWKKTYFVYNGWFKRIVAISKFDST